MGGMYYSRVRRSPQYGETLSTLKNALGNSSGVRSWQNSVQFKRTAPRYWTPGALSASVTRHTMQGWFYTNEGVIGVTRYPWSREPRTCAFRGSLTYAALFVIWAFCIRDPGFSILNSGSLDSIDAYLKIPAKRCVAATGRLGQLMKSIHPSIHLVDLLDSQITFSNS